MNADLAKKMTTFVRHHDVTVRAAVQLATTSILRHKILGYVDSDGWLDWDRLAADLASGLPWSGGELRLARLGCSLAGHMPERLRDPGHLDSWSLAEMLNGLDESNTTAVLNAITFAATGRPGDAR